MRASCICSRPRRSCARVPATVDRSIAEDACDVTAHLRGGKQAHVRVDHAVGSLEKPMSDADLEAKFRGLCEPILGSDRSHELLQHCWKLAESKDVRALVAAGRK